jgi:putative transposase
MKQPERHDPQQKALWRFGIIAPLLHHGDDDPALTKMLGQLATKTYIRSDASAVRLSAETLRKWLYRYRKGGFAALADQVRSDKGRHHVDRPTFEAMGKLRENNPQWTLAKILERMLADGVWNGIRPSRATMYRIATANQLHRNPTAPATVGRAFAFTCFGQLWMADFMHGPKLRCGRRFKKAILHAIIDDASRYVISARFYFNETVEVLLTEMMIAVRRFGLCQRFYTDNGPSYASAHLKQVCARLGMHLVHTPPYQPQGRGKVERFFRTVREQFLSEQHAGTLDRLNADLNEYLAEYHQRIHRGIGASPLQKRMGIENVCRPLPEVTDLQNLFCMHQCRKVYNDATIRLNGRIFEVPGCVPGTKADIFYLPWDNTWVYYGNDMRPARLLDKSANANRFNHPNGGKS